MHMGKVRALAAFLNVPAADISATSDGFYQCYDCEFSVLSEEEAEDAFEEERQLAEAEGENYEELERADLLSDDGEENEEGAFYIYRQN